MAGKTMQVYALARAAEILGGAARLARRLGISQTRLRLYLDDVERLPQALFLKLVDVLSDAEMKKLAEEHIARDEEVGSPKKNGNTRRNGHDKDKRGDDR